MTTGWLAQAPQPKEWKSSTAYTHLLWLASSVRNPWLRFVPGLVESEQTRLSTALDELIRLGDEFGGEDPAGQLGIGCDRV
jgi:hypothetical protein